MKVDLDSGSTMSLYSAAFVNTAFLTSILFFFFFSCSASFFPQQYVVTSKPYCIIYNEEKGIGILVIRFIIRTCSQQKRYQVLINWLMFPWMEIETACLIYQMCECQWIHYSAELWPAALFSCELTLDPWESHTNNYSLPSTFTYTRHKVV